MTNGDALRAQEYDVRMRDALAERGEAAFERAYETGRRALAESAGSLELVAGSDSATVPGGRGLAGDRDLNRLLDHAFDCLAGSFSPLELVVRGVQQSTSLLWQSFKSLQGVAEQLRQQNEKLTTAHRAVERERSRYHTLFEFAPDGYLVTGIEGAIREANTAAGVLLQTPKDLLPGQSITEFVIEKDRHEFRECLHKLHTGAIDRIEDWQIHLHPRNGSPIRVALTVVAERTAPAIASLCWLFRDVSKRRRLEKERSRSLVGKARARAGRRSSILAEASALFVASQDVEANLVNVARLAVARLGGWCFISVVDADGRFRQLEVAHADPSLAGLADELRRYPLWGRQAQGEGAQLMSPETAVPLTRSWCERIAESPEHADLLGQLEGSTAMLLPLRIRERLLGAVTLISPPAPRASASMDRDLGEDLARLCALALDNARLHRDVVIEKDKVEQAGRAQDDFVSILAHELRNPLTPVMGWIQILKNHALASQDVVIREGVGAMERNARKLERLVTDCIDLASIPEGAVRIDPTAVDLNQIVSASLETVRPLAVAGGLTITVELGAEPQLVLGEAIRLEQVVTNLLINAVRYSDREGIISVRVMQVGPDAEIEIRDTGIGLDPAFFGQIFQPFRQGTSSWLTSQSGLGLGLTIARRIVEMHGGRVWAESPGLGQGSTFRVRIPLAVGSEAKCAGELLLQQPAPAGHPIRILLVEDADDILLLMKTELEALGYRVTTASDGRAGMEAAKSSPPDLIISDIKMPWVDGYELMRAIRATAELSAIPAIALTGFGGKLTNDRALAAGFNICLSKPAPREAMLAEIRRLTEPRPAPAASTPPASPAERTETE